MATRLICVRHGESTWNAIHRIQGQANDDIRLTELGRRQAERTGEVLARRGLAAIYTSDLTRAVETAQSLATRVRLTPTLDERLREQSFGDLEGSMWTELEAKDPTAWRALMEHDFDTRMPNGESRADLTARARNVLEEIGGRHDGDTVAVFTHGGFLRFFLRWVLQVPEAARVVPRLPNCAISEFRRRRADRWSLEVWASVAHLAE